MKLVMKHQAQFLLVTFLTPFISAFISTPSKQKCFQWRLSSESGDELNDGGKSLSSVLLKRDQDEREVNSVISSLETTFLGPNSRSKSRFKDLIDLYEVQWVLSSNKKNNPVGGKWTNENGQMKMALLKNYFAPERHSSICYHTTKQVWHVIQKLQWLKQSM